MGYTLLHFYRIPVGDFYTPRFNEVEKGYTGFTSSVRMSVSPFICGQNHVRSVSSPILAGSISYEFLANFLICNSHSCYDMGSDMNPKYG